MCREYEFAGMMVERFAGYHRQSYGGCKVGVGDVLIGAAALAADYNGVPKATVFTAPHEQVHEPAAAPPACGAGVCCG